jgi:hypothetical protein
VGDIVNVPCRGEFLVTRLQPGTYWFEFASGKRPVSERERASVQVQVVDHNLAVKAALSRGIDIEGRFTVPEGSSKPDWTAVKLFSDPVGTIRVLDEMPEPPDAGGRFHLVNLAPRDHRFSVSGLPAGYYVQEVRYNGARMPDGWLALSAGAPGQSVEVLVGNTPAALTGTVKDGDSARVVLIHWPPNPAEIRHSTTTATADPDGKFQLTNLAPGDYRYFAVRAGAIDKLQEPYVMDHALQSARKLTLGPGIVQSIELEMIDP